MWLLKFWCLYAKELTGKISACPGNTTYTQETSQGRHHDSAHSTTDVPGSYEIPSFWLSSLEPGMEYFHKVTVSPQTLFSSGLMLLGVPWAAQFGSAVVPLGGWSIAGCLSDSLLEVSVGYLTASSTLHLRCVSCDDKGVDLCTHGDFGGLNSTGHFRWVRTHHHPAPRDNCWLTTVNTSS